MQVEAIIRTDCTSMARAFIAIDPEPDALEPELAPPAEPVVLPVLPLPAPVVPTPLLPEPVADPDPLLPDRLPPIEAVLSLARPVIST